MAIICYKLGLIYIQVPGTGCSVVGKLLIEQFEGKELGRKHNDVLEVVGKGLLSEKQLEEYIVVANVRNPFDRIVTYYQRLSGSWTEKNISWEKRNLERKYCRGDLSHDLYNKRVESLAKTAIKKRRRAQVIQHLGFNTWLQVTMLKWHTRVWFRSTASQEYLFPMLAGVDLVLKQEKLEDAVNELLLLLGVEDKVSLPRKNLTPGKKSYTAYYNQLSRWLFEKLYRDELKYFDYYFGSGVVGNNSIVHLTNRLQRKVEQ